MGGHSKIDQASTEGVERLALFILKSCVILKVFHFKKSPIRDSIAVMRRKYAREKADEWFGDCPQTRVHGFSRQFLTFCN